MVNFLSLNRERTASLVSEFRLLLWLGLSICFLTLRVIKAWWGCHPLLDNRLTTKTSRAPKNCCAFKYNNAKQREFRQNRFLIGQTN